jgi:mRNA-degrading endonuclease RelE of RelBE toxin-antitoxin system
VIYRIRFTRQAAKDVEKLSPKLRTKLKEILRTGLSVNPRSGKALVGELKGYYSLRLSYKDRVVYSVHDDVLLVLVVRARAHYGD